jgi:hypothetical protein
MTSIAAYLLAQALVADAPSYRERAPKPGIAARARRLVGRLFAASSVDRTEPYLDIPTPTLNGYPVAR